MQGKGTAGCLAGAEDAEALVMIGVYVLRGRYLVGVWMGGDQGSARQDDVAAYAELMLNRLP
jgi:hypothetical protein